MSAPRKHTKFQVCRQHAWLLLETRQRRAEFFSEGGPTDAPCSSDKPCQMWAGTDLFITQVCEGPYVGHHAPPWPVNGSTLFA